MHSVRDRAHRLIDLMIDEDLEVLWASMQTQFYDSAFVAGRASAKENFKPGDILTREEALALVTASAVPTANLTSQMHRPR